MERVWVDYDEVVSNSPRDQKGFKKGSLFYEAPNHATSAPPQPQPNPQPQSASPKSRNDIFNLNHSYAPIDIIHSSSRNDIFNLDHSVRKPAVKMTSDELQILKSPYYDASIIVLDQPVRAVNNEFISIPINTSRDIEKLLTPNPVLIRKEDRRSFHLLDEQQVYIF
jgi:hypothetical protein